jgi:ATP-binding cassette, subfamily F, member 3
MKTILQLNKINKAYGPQTIFEDVSISFHANQKIGVIGCNGSGKSTLCKIITGHEEQDSGQIQKSSNCRLAYLEQQDPYSLDEKVVDFLVRYTGKEAWECGKIASRFQIKTSMLESTLSQLAGGYRMRVKLTAMLLKDPNFLILDEPTNYLDLKTLILLEEFLQDYRGGFLVVSHDREFLIKTCQHTLEIANGSCTLYPGNVEQYLIFKEEQAKTTESYNKGIIAKQKQLQTFVDRFRAKASKASQAKSKMKQIDRLKTIDTAHSLGRVRIKIPNVNKQNSMAFRCKDLSIGYPEHLVASKIDMEFDRGSHIAILGDNGQGKTTFMRTIANDLKTRGGEFKWGHGLEVVYYAQHVFSTLNPKGTVYDHLSGMAADSVTSQEILNLAGSFLFKGDHIKKSISVLSGGERARLCLAGLLLTKSGVLLFDEPTNHLDFETVEALGKALKKFNGTVFFISHDRTFVNMLATQIIEVNDGAVVRYPGNYEEYVYSMEKRIHEEAEEDADPKPEAKKTNQVNRKEIKQLRALKVELNSKLKKIQARLDRHKKEREEIFQAFSNDADAWSHDKNARYEYLERAISKEEDQWLELTDQIDKLTRQIK